MSGSLAARVLTTVSGGPLTIGISPTAGANSRSKGVRVVVVASSPMSRDLLSRAFLGEPEIDIVGVTAPEGVIRNLTSARAEVIVWDALQRKSLSALALVAEVVGSRTVLIADVWDEQLISQLASVRVAGLASLDSDFKTLVEAVHSVANGQCSYSPDVTPALMKYLRRDLEGHEREVALTDRERDVARLLGEGATNKAIASELHLAIHTVKNHVHALLTKLNVRNRAEAAVAIRTRHIVT